MAFGFPARFTERRTFPDHQDALLAAVKSAMENLGWRYTVLWGEEFQASVPISGWSWGEKLSVKVLPGGVIQAESKCAGYRPQLFDFGKNKKNVKAFFDRIERMTSPS
jgi:hypothetical protein